MHLRADEIAAWLQQRAAMAAARGFVVGLSGGVDSAVVLGLCARAAPDHVAAVILPCGSDPQDEADARLVAEHFQTDVLRVDLAPAYDRLAADLQGALASLPAHHRPPAGGEPEDPRAALPLANLKPRLRMASLYFVANSLNYLVAGTGNRCELTIGYFTKYGDGGVDVLPIGPLLKSDVRALARDLDVPDRIVEKTPSAGLWSGQSDEADMGFTYAELERYLVEGPQGVPPALALRIERLVRQTEHKRAGPAMPGRE